MWNAFLIDTDDPRTACTLPLDGRLLVVTETSVKIVTEEGRCWRVDEAGGEVIGVLMPTALEPGIYRWCPATVRFDEWQQGTPFVVGASGLTVLDVR